MKDFFTIESKKEFWDVVRFIRGGRRTGFATTPAGSFIHSEFVRDGMFLDFWWGCKNSDMIYVYVNDIAKQVYRYYPKSGTLERYVDNKLDDVWTK